MGREIERKFLVKNSTWRAIADAGRDFRQGYLSLDRARSVRIRVSNDEAFITIKGPSQGIGRSEFEYAIPKEDGEALLRMCLRPPISKTRYLVPHQDHQWEVDVFHDGNDGLVVAEIELNDEAEEVHLPDWVGSEVSEDPRFYNIYLAEHPFREWRGTD